MWDETFWVSLQCNAEQSTMLTLNLSHSLFSPRPLDLGKAKEETNKQKKQI